jgi:purine-nucleoside phosphorylase
MYRSFTAEQYRKHLQLSDSYKVDGVLCYGTLYEERTISVLETCLAEMGVKPEIKSLSHPFLRFARELQINDKKFWFMIGYGGAWLSEYLHWACLFGSKKNILVGSCGGLKTGMKPGDFIIPSSSYGQESSARMYNRDDPVQYADKDLSAALEAKIKDEHTKTWRGPTITCQAMIGETLEDVQKWSREGYYGVEMEASTVIAVSNHFGVPSAVSLYVGDNLIEQHSNMSEEYTNEADLREQNQRKQIKAALELLLG